MMTIKIKTTNLPQNEILKDFIQKKLRNVDKRLPKDFGAIIEIELAKVTKHHQEGNFFKAEMQLEVPGGKMIRSVSTRDTIEKAVAEAGDNLVMELDEYKDKLSLERRRKVGKPRGEA